MLMVEIAEITLSIQMPQGHYREDASAICKAIQCIDLTEVLACRLESSMGYIPARLVVTSTDSAGAPRLATHALRKGSPPSERGRAPGDA